MNRARTRVLFAAFGLALGGAWALAALEEDRTMSPLSAPVGEVPAIDKEIPVKLETATFALG